MTKQLRSYQSSANTTVDGVRARGERRALVVMATGLGKTVTAAEYARQWLEEHPNDRLLFLAHSADILTQARKEFREACGRRMTMELITGRTKKGKTTQAVFATFQSMLNLLDEFPSDTFGLIIVDEAHHGWAATYKPVIDHFTPEFLYGMTATPDRGDGLDIRDIFGPEVFNYSLSRGIAEGWLAHIDYRVLTDNIDIDKLRELVQRIAGGDRTVSRRQIDDTIFIEERIDAQVAIIHEAQGDGKQTLVFCRNIDHLKAVHRLFPEATPYYSGLRNSTLDGILDRFRQREVQTLLVIDKMNEGVDLPEAEVLAFLRATDSRNVWLQQLGRGTRKTTTKTRVLVLDFVSNCDRILAVQELGLAVTQHTERGGQFSVVEVSGLHVSFSEELRNLVTMLQKLSSGFYPALEEASAAAQKLRVKSRKEYLARYKEDSRLPSSPYSLYEADWQGGEKDLGINSYETYEEASAAAQKLGVRSSNEYSRRYKEDPRLVSHPYTIYAGHGWVDWPTFLGTNFYETYEEAAAAVRRLGIKGQKEYKKRYKEDPRLPSEPNKVYAGKGWISLSVFLGTEGAPRSVKVTDPYPTLAEASAAARKLGILTQAEYKQRHKEDARLVAGPNTTYRDKGWKGYRHFLGTEGMPLHIKKNKK